MGPPFLVVEDGVIDLGPELSDEVGGCVDAYVQAPLAAGVGECALGAWVVGVGEGGGHAGAEDFADVEGFVAAVGAGDYGAAQGVFGFVPVAAITQGVEAGVFVSGDGDEELHEIVFAGLVEGGVPEVASVADTAVMELGGLGGGVIVDGNDGGQDDGAVVEAVSGGVHELFADGLGRELVGGADGAEVGNDA